MERNILTVSDYCMCYVIPCCWKCHTFLILFCRFTLLYNSENDNLNPRSTADIIKQLEREEQEEKKLCAAATSTNVSSD